MAVRLWVKLISSCAWYFPVSPPPPRLILRASLHIFQTSFSYFPDSIVWKIYPLSPFHISVHIPKIIHCCYILVLSKMNFLTQSSQIPDKQASVLFLQQRGVLHNPKICANGHQMTLQLSDNGDHWRCRSRQCRTESGLRIGRWLEHARLPYITLFIAGRTK